VAKEPVPPADGGDVQLKDRGLAAFLAWLIPGAGHAYQGRRAKAGIFFTCVMGTFMYGMWLGDGRVVYAQWQPAKFRRYPFLCQVGVGLPSLPALIAARVPAAGHLPLVADKRWYVPPTEEELHALHRDLNRRFELGTVFTMIAGLLNMLVIYDAWGGPAFREVPKDKEPKKETTGDAPAGNA
jgi:hypothetical protein